MRQLPGIVFETVAPPLADTLPRMDIAAFVGFASFGPVDVPVAVEDIGRFRDLFGDDVALAWDGERNRPQYGLLARAVESFFDNGGSRCYVVRVAHRERLDSSGIDLPGGNNGRPPEHAYTHVFDLPGMRGVGGTISYPLRMRARSPGSWARDLNVGATLRPAVLAILPGSAAQINPDFKIGAGGAMQDVTIGVAAPPGAVTVGDLMELSFDPGDLHLFAAVTGAESIDRGLRLTVGLLPGETTWQWALRASGSPPDPDSSLRSAWLELLDDGAGLAAQRAWTALEPSERSLSLRRLTFEITIWRDERLLSRIDELSFCPRHPRFFGNLPSDEALFARPRQRRADRRDDEYEALFLEASGDRVRPGGGAGRRFPLAGPMDALLGPNWPLYLPDGMDLGRTYARAAAALPLGPSDTHAQDGLTALAPTLFFDERLQDYSGESLLRTAEQLLNSVREWEHRPHRPGERPPERLRGLHALLPIQEATLAAVPDAALRPWSSDPMPARAVLPAPWLDPAAGPDSAGRLRLSWNEVKGTSDYRLEWDTSPDFVSPELAFEGAARTVRLNLPESCARTAYFRVRAQDFGEPSPWSNTRAYQFQADGFLPCAQRDVPELSLAAANGSPEGGPARIVWSALPPGLAFVPGTRFQVESAIDALFQSARTVAETSDLGYDLPAVRTGLSYYRVRGLFGDAQGPWSNTLSFGPTGTDRPFSQPGNASFDDGILLGVHRALLRFCAARGDLLALLALPRHYGAPETLDYLAALTPDDTAPELALDAARRGRRPLTLGEGYVLSYGAVYHPWTARVVTLSDGRRDTDFIPPVGAVAGKLANTALSRGAWISCANEPLTGVLALDPSLGDSQLLQLTSQQINPVRRDSRGFVLANDETLSRSSETLQVSVRRLMILLKRLALREGSEDVFEPLVADFPDRVRHRFQVLLSNLHRRGALQGEDQDEAFRVVVDASLNPPQSLDLGRFVVELRVAPARPLSFLRVRLIQSGPNELAVGEV